MVSKKNWMRVFAGATAAAAALTLSACGGGGNSGADATQLSDEDVTISVDFWGGDARVQLTQKVIDAFEAEHKNITVEPQYADWNGYWDGLATSTAAGTMPDVVQMDELYLASYAGKGALLDLGTTNLDTSKVDQALLDTGKVDGKLYAMPTGAGVYSVIANKDLFDKYGVALPDDETWTWDDYAKIANEISEKSGGKVAGSDQMGGFDAGSVKYWARQDGGEIFGEGNKVTLNPESLAKMWQYELDLQKSGGMWGPAKITESFNAGTSANGLATSKVAMSTQYNTQLTAFEAANKSHFVLLKLPEPKDIHPNSYKPAMYWTVAATSKHPAEAALFADYLVNDPEAAKIIGTDRGVPANPDSQKAIESTLTSADKDAIAYAKRVTPGEAPLVTPNGASTIEAILQRYTQDVFAGKQKPLDAAKAFINELQGEIDAA